MHLPRVVLSDGYACGAPGLPDGGDWTHPDRWTLSESAAQALLDPGHDAILLRTDPEDTDLFDEGRRAARWAVQPERTVFTPSSVARHLKDADVDLRPRGGGSRPPAATRLPLHDLPLLQRTLNTDGGLARARRFADAVRFPTMTAAAESMGLDQNSWVMQMRRLERDAGAELVERAERGRPQRATAAGQALLAELVTLERRIAEAAVLAG